TPPALPHRQGRWGCGRPAARAPPPGRDRDCPVPHRPAPGRRCPRSSVLLISDIRSYIRTAPLARDAGPAPGRQARITRTVGSAAVRQVLVGGDQRRLGCDLDELVLLHPVAEALPVRLVDAAGLLPGRRRQQRERVRHAALEERDLVLGNL